MKLKRAILVILLGMAFGMEAHAQIAIEDSVESAPRIWSNTPLNWNEFKGKMPENSVEHWLEYTIDAVDTTEKINGLNLEHFKLSSVMLPSRSWVEESAKTGRNLHYNQVIFNLAEIQSRCFQPMFDRVVTDDERDSIIKMAMAFAIDDEQRFSDCCDFGADSAEVEYWLDSTQRVLKAFPSVVPSIKDIDWGINAHMGMGFTRYGGQLTTDFNSPLSYAFGCELFQGRHSFMMDFLIGGSKANRNFIIDDEYFVAGSSYTWMQFMLGYQFYAIRNPYWDLAPFVAVGLSGISESAGDDDSYSDATGSWFAGLKWDYNFHKNLSLLYDSYDGLGIRVALYASRTKFQDYKCVSLNMMVALNFMARTVAIKK